MIIDTFFVFEKKNKQQKTKGILSVHTSSIMPFPSRPLDEIQPNLVCESLT